MTVDLPPGIHKSLRLKNLPRGVVVSITLECSQPFTVSVLGGADLRRYPDTRESLFSATVEQRLSFVVTIPVSADYYVVFDNRKAAAATRVKIDVKAQRPSTTPGLDPKPPTHSF